MCKSENGLRIHHLLFVLCRDVGKPAEGSYCSPLIDVFLGGPTDLDLFATLDTFAYKSFVKK